VGYRTRWHRSHSLQQVLMREHNCYAVEGHRYVAESTVIERNDREISFAPDGTGSEHQTIVVRVQTEAAVKNLSVVSFTYASASQRVDIEYIRVRLRAGDRLEWSARLVHTAAEAPGRFWGIYAFTGREAVALAETFTLRLPRSVAITVWSPKQPAKITEEGAERFYRWTSSQLDPTGGPEAESRTEAEKKRTLTPEETRPHRRRSASHRLDKLS